MSCFNVKYQWWHFKPSFSGKVHYDAPFNSESSCSASLSILLPLIDVAFIPYIRNRYSFAVLLDGYSRLAWANEDLDLWVVCKNGHTRCRILNLEYACACIRTQNTHLAKNRTHRTTMFCFFCIVGKKLDFVSLELRYPKLDFVSLDYFQGTHWYSSSPKRWDSKWSSEWKSGPTQLSLTTWNILFDNW